MGNGEWGMGTKASYSCNLVGQASRLSLKVEKVVRAASSSPSLSRVKPDRRSHLTPASVLPPQNQPRVALSEANKHPIEYLPVHFHLKLIL